MSHLSNLTPFSAAYLPSMGLHDEDLALVLVTGRFSMPPAGRPNAAPLVPHEEQRPAVLADEYWGDAEDSSLRWEGQAVPARAGTDVYVEGHAWSPAGRPTTHSSVGVRVGPIQRGAVVYGERFWREGLLGLQPSAPAPFTRLPVVYERCFGGRAQGSGRGRAAASDRNPVGRGLDARAGNLLPNFEDPQRLIATPDDRPLPQGFGPIARYWQPRRTYAGTYDDLWLRTRAPFWPSDFDPRFFCAASPGLCAIPHLQGGEPVRLVGFSPDGSIDFVLPRVALQCKFRFHAREIVEPMVLDGVVLEPDESALTMIWRARAVTTREPLALDSVVIRELEHWEFAA